jgi:hypothetical protein
MHQGQFKIRKIFWHAPLQAGREPVLSPSPVASLLGFPPPQPQKTLDAMVQEFFEFKVKQAQPRA